MRIGILGGSFNPVHNGHIAIAKIILREFGLDKVIFMVAKDPPHKTLADGVSAGIRLRMTEESLKDHPGLEASDLELKRTGKSYTVDTVRELQALYKEARIFCIVGGDMLVTLPRWHEAEELMRIGEFIGISRPDEKRDLEAAVKFLERDYGARVYLSAGSGPDISSSEVRARVRDALPVSGLIPPAAERMAYENLLYVPDDVEAMGRRLRAALKPSRYIHTMGTVRCAIELAARYGVDPQKARLAALLHDCGKLSREQQLELAREFGLDARAADPALLHGPIGARLAQRDYGVEDKEILLAIQNHTLCRPGMTPVEKVTYLADKIEPGREYEDVGQIRGAALRGLDEGVLACMDSSIAFVNNSAKTLDPAILAAREYLIKEMRKEL